MTTQPSATQSDAPDAGQTIETVNESVAEAASDTVQNAGKLYEGAREGAEKTLGKAADKERSVLNSLSKAQKEAGSKITPIPADFDAVSSPSDLKARLDWGEPGLSIVDVRDREAHNNERIMGAVPMPLDTVVDRANSAFEAERDIYVYGESDDQAQQAISQLRSAGFKRVSLIKGGLSAWKAVNGATEGRATVPGLFDEGEGASIIGQSATP